MDIGHPLTHITIASTRKNLPSFEETWRKIKFKFKILTNLPWGVIELLYWH